MKDRKTRAKKEKKLKQGKVPKIGKTGRRNMTKSIIGRLMFLGLVSFLATLILGGAGVLQLNSNNKNTTLLNSVNKINLLQNSNTASETTFRYTLNYSSNAEIVKNLTSMQEQVDIAKANAGKGYQSKVRSIEDKINSIKDAMLVLSDSYIERGLKEEDGLYAEFLQYDKEISSQFAALPTDVYWTGLLDDVNENFHEYTLAVAEGADTEELSQKVLSSLSVIIDKAMSYSMNNRAASGVITSLESKRAAFDNVCSYDSKITNSKSMVNSLNADLTYYCTELQELVAKDAQAALVSMTVLIVAILAGSAVVIVTLTFFVAKGVKKSISAFEGTLSEIAGGDMTVTAKTNAGNEFDAFGVSLNKMTEVLHGTLENVNNIATEVNTSGNGLQNMAESTSTISNQVSTTIDQIASGATTQAEDVEQSALQMSELGRFMSNIVTNVADLDETAENMANAGAEAAGIMKELDVSNGKMTEGIGKISAQINKTNDSVQSIKNATSMIASIASQTNLLSLNAAIEAARAGDAGRGFAVVASEIQQLADQSNKSASDIDKVINTLIADFKETLSVMTEVEATTAVQNEKLTNTREKFDIVSSGINATKDKTVEIRNAIEECNKVQMKVDQLISNLSAISEEYAASTTEAAQSMSELNDTITQLLGESNKLIEISETLENSMKAFTL